MVQTPCHIQSPGADSQKGGLYSSPTVRTPCHIQSPGAGSQKGSPFSSRAAPPKTNPQPPEFLQSIVSIFERSFREFPYLMETSLEPARMMQPGPTSLGATHAC